MKKQPGSSTLIEATKYDLMDITPADQISLECKCTPEHRRIINGLNDLMTALIGSPDICFGSGEPYAIMYNDLIFSDSNKGGFTYCFDRIVKLDKPIDELIHDLNFYTSGWELLILKKINFKGVSFELFDSYLVDKNLFVKSEHLKHYGLSYSKVLGWHESE